MSSYALEISERAQNCGPDTYPDGRRVNDCKPLPCSEKQLKLNIVKLVLCDCNIILFLKGFL